MLYNVSETFKRELHASRENVLTYARLLPLLERHGWHHRRIYESTGPVLEIDTHQGCIITCKIPVVTDSCHQKSLMDIYQVYGNFLSEMLWQGNA